MISSLATTTFGYGLATRCTSIGACVFGDTHSKTVAVLFGDSHALMWLPAINPTAVADHVRLDVVWLGGCPPATAPVYYPPFGDPAKCDAWRTREIRDIQDLSPSMVLLAGRSSLVRSGPGVFYTNLQWANALATTIRDFTSHHAKVAVIEDTVDFPIPTNTCVAAHPDDVQECSVPWPRRRSHGLQIGERSAAEATGATYISTQQWFCTRRCSPVIGDFVVYVDQDHVSTAYAEHLSVVMGNALTPLFRSRTR